MADVIQQLAFRLIRKVVPTVWSLALLAIALGAGYFVGQRWGEAQGEPNGIWFGLLGGFGVWSIFLRPRGSRRRRRSRGLTNYQSDDGMEAVGSVAMTIVVAEEETTETSGGRFSQEAVMPIRRV